MSTTEIRSLPVTLNADELQLRGDQLATRVKEQRAGGGRPRTSGSPLDAGTTGD